jgi:hypothetical protein
MCPQKLYPSVTFGCLARLCVDDVRAPSQTHTSHLQVQRIDVVAHRRAQTWLLNEVGTGSYEHSLAEGHGPSEGLGFRPSL